MGENINIEDQIDSRIRLQEGIFFTGNHIVEEIFEQFSFDSVETVVDTAAGSCNFLIPLALKYPHIRFYGVEKNEMVYNHTLKTIGNIPNIHYFQGDIVFDEFDIPPCDLYLGNPPFVNFTDLSEEYREKLIPVWKEYFKISQGFNMLLGDSRGDLAQLIFYLSVHKFLKPGGQLGVVLPDSLIKGNSASAGFREFKGISVKSLVDISYKNAFIHTGRNCFYILAEKGGETKFPLSYYCRDAVKKLIKFENDLVEDCRNILGPSEYTSRQGINTLGANKIFFYRETPPLESGLIKPLLKSSDVKAWGCTPSSQVLLPYENGSIIEEKVLKKKYPEAYAYLEQFKETLALRKSRFVRKAWYCLFGIGDYTFKKYKVVWRALGAKFLEACVTSDALPNQAMHCYISTDNRDEAHYICAVMNSRLYRSQLHLLNEAGARSFAQPSTIAKIRLNRYCAGDPRHKKLSELSLALHKKYSSRQENRLNTLVEELYS